ncbi:MAG: geranylgeranyl reductase family protein [Thermotogae bacterium]|nr:geranylgeranyl reductase family protein [Thermotogota bacterium]
MKKYDFDCIVVGAGPAGSTTAYELKNRGMKVLLIDRVFFPRYKPCAGGLTRKAIKLLNDVPLDDVIDCKIKKVAFTLDLKLGFEFSYSRPLIYTVSREKFDDVLLEKALNAGVVVSYDQYPVAVESAFDSVTLKTNKASYKTMFLVGADGGYSKIAQLAKFTKRPLRLVAVEDEIEVPSDVLEKFKDKVRIDLKTSFRGYRWVFPKRNYLSVGLGGTLKTLSNTLDKEISSYIEELGISKYKKSERNYVYPIGGVRTEYARGRIFLVGDAAEIADPMTGEGIYYAIYSGKLLALFLSKKHDEPLALAYNELMTERFFKRQKWGKYAGYLFYTYLKHFYHRLNNEHGKYAFERLISDPDFSYKKIFGLHALKWIK